MIAELFTNNALNLVIIFGSCAALILMSFWFRRGNRKRKGFLFHAVQFLIYTIIISAVGSIINYVIENYKLKFITPGVIDFICGRCEQVPDMRSCLSSGAMEQGSS